MEINHNQGSEEEDKRPLIEQVMVLVEQVGKQMQAEDDEESRWASAALHESGIS
ncbi:hypothetical protein [Paenibacillus sp. KS1]|uniref:hypothetical protein n=1 Tax=Paenibacillus sp. KS1 TaxID=1849249 RepID=UPI0020C7DB72|nr:hypothetical protein [Paenibacillus sp. KS1]